MRSGQRGWQLWRQPLVVVLVAWVLVWAVYIALDPAVLLHSWLFLPQPYVEGLKFLATHDTGGSHRLLARRGLDGGQRLVLARHPVGQAVDAGPRPAGGRPVVLVALVVREGSAGRRWRQTLVAVALPALVLFVFELPNPRTLGVRYLLPSLAAVDRPRIADRPGDVTAVWRRRRWD